MSSFPRGFRCGIERVARCDGNWLMTLSRAQKYDMKKSEDTHRIL